MHAKAMGLGMSRNEPVSKLGHLAAPKLGHDAAEGGQQAGAHGLDVAAGGARRSTSRDVAWRCGATSASSSPRNSIAAAIVLRTTSCSGAPSK